MKTTVDFYDFKHAFERIRPNNFSPEGLSVLWDYLEEYEDSTGTEMELDVIALCCDFSECHYTEIAQSYRIDLSDIENDDDQRRAVGEYLQDEGAFVGEVEGGFVYRAH